MVKVVCFLVAYGDGKGGLGSNTTLFSSHKVYFWLDDGNLV